MDGPVKTRTVIPGLLLVVWFVILLLWGDSFPSAIQPFLGYLYVGTCLIGFPLALRHILEEAGLTAIKTETHHGRGFVLRGRRAVTLGQRMILCGRCLVWFGLGIVWMGLVYEWIRKP